MAPLFALSACLCFRIEIPSTTCYIYYHHCIEILVKVVFYHLERVHKIKPSDLKQEQRIQCHCV